MSVVVSSGFRFLSCDLFEIHGAVSDWRTVLASMHEKRIAATLADWCVSMIDGHADDGRVHDDCRGRSPLSFAWSEMNRRRKEILAGGYRDPEVDFDFEISILPFEGAVYGMVFTEQADWQEAWRAQGVSADFAYWDNSDRPEGVTSADWADRARVWSGILGSNAAGSPGMSGFTAQCVDRLQAPEAAAVLAAAPSVEERIDSRARTVALHRLMEIEMEKRSGNRSPASYMEAFSAAESVLRGTEAGRIILDAERSRLRPLLSAELSVQDLTRTFPAT